MHIVVIFIIIVIAAIVVIVYTYQTSCVFCYFDCAGIVLNTTNQQSGFIVPVYNRNNQSHNLSQVVLLHFVLYFTIKAIQFAFLFFYSLLNIRTKKQRYWHNKINFFTSKSLFLNNILIKSNLVDPASSHTLVSKIKPCKCKIRPHVNGRLCGRLIKTVMVSLMVFFLLLG